MLSTKKKDKKDTRDGKMTIYHINSVTFTFKIATFK